MYNKSVFIVFPWPAMNYSGIELNRVQIRSSYDIVIKAMLYKMQYEKAKAANQGKNYEKYNLRNTKVFFAFRDEILANLAEPEARDYIINCLVAIRESDFSKQCVRDSFETLKTYLSETNNATIIKNALVDEKSFINFPSIFKYANEETIDENSIIVRKIKNVIEAYKDRKIK